MSDTAARTITDAEVVEAITHATQEVFSMMIGMEVAPGEPFSGRSAGTEAGVLALVGLAGEWNGTGSISCSPKMARRLASLMLMGAYESIDDEVLDAIAEVANMIIGNIKTDLERKIGSMALSTPTVIFGHNFETRRVGGQEWISVPFPCEGEEIRVQICLAPSRESGTQRPGFTLPHAMQL